MNNYPQRDDYSFSSRQAAGTGHSRSIFVTHSSKDLRVISVVKQAFREVGLKPIINEEQAAPRPPVAQIVQAITQSKGLFAFLTPNSLALRTRDWVIFEIGVGVAVGLQVFVWKDSSLRRHRLPKLLSQICTYRDYDISDPIGIPSLIEEVRQVAMRARRF